MKKDLHVALSAKCKRIIANSVSGNFFRFILAFVAMTAFTSSAGTHRRYPGQDIDPYIIRRCQDFKVTGSGTNEQWASTAWQTFTMLEQGIPYPTKSKMMYSDSGIYLLFQGEDKKITTKDYKDFQNIYDGDVFEVFFHPDTSQLLYFEYEINHLGKELILILSRTPGKTLAWTPWDYEYIKHPQIQKAVSVLGGERKPGANIKSWSAEIFFPYSVFKFLPLTPPKSGTRWNANFCRIDYDNGKEIEYSWSPTITKGFHQLEQFKPIQFE